MISAISKYTPTWLMAIIATALVLATSVGSKQDSARAIDPADTDTVYVADGTDFADALMGATIASLNTSPMLGVAPDTIPGDTREELDRLTNDRSNLLDTIYVFGGKSAVSSSVFQDLGDWANNVQRIQGSTRWGTYRAISEMLPSAIDEAVHARRADDADALDGRDGSHYLSRSNHTGTQPPTSIAPQGEGSGLDADSVDGVNSSRLQLPDSLPSGRTLRGLYALSTETDGEFGDFEAGAQSFQLPLSSAPSVHFIAEDESPPPPRVSWIGRRPTG